MVLYFLRHGDAIESPYYRDDDRPLSDVGKRQIQSVAQYLHITRASIELILSSPLTRARETAEILQGILAVHPFMTTEVLRSGEIRDLINEINNHESDSLLLVGHEPQLSSAISVLTGGDEHFRLEMKKGSLARVETPFPAKKGHAVLSWLLTAVQMESIR